MRQLRMNLRHVTVVCASVLYAGCAANVDPSESAESVGTESQASIVGVWQFGLSNGDAGSNPVVWNDVVPCQQFSSSDGRFHPGKLWKGQCRSEFGGQVMYGNSYAALQFTLGHALVEQSNQGFTPSTAITGSSPGLLPVCRPFTRSQSTGKVWQGTCLFEFADQAAGTSSFAFLVQQ